MDRRQQQIFRQAGSRIKAPKLCFLDTGLLRYLLGSRRPADLALRSARGAGFENYVVPELAKAYWHQGLEPPLFFWRDSAGHEVDLLVEAAEELFPIEVKSGQTLGADALLAQFGLTKQRHHLPAALSTGERQRVALARALFNRPALLLANEPTGNLDEASSETVLRALADFAAAGGAVLLVTHDARAARYASRRLSLAAGRLTPCESQD